MDIYPDATKPHDDKSQAVDQAWALEFTARHAEEANKTLSQRVPALMVLAILGLFGGVYSLYIAAVTYYRLQHIPVSSDTVTIGLVIVAGVSLFQLVVNLYLPLGKNKHAVALVLKVLLVLQAISVFGVFFGGRATGGLSALFGAAMLLFIFYVYTRVKSLQNL